MESGDRWRQVFECVCRAMYVPESAICSVRGMGVAESVRTSTPLARAFSFIHDI